MEISSVESCRAFLISPSPQSSTSLFLSSAHYLSLSLSPSVSLPLHPPPTPSQGCTASFCVLGLRWQALCSGSSAVFTVGSVQGQVFSLRPGRWMWHGTYTAWQ